MAYRPHPKGARTNPSSPRAWATCDRSGFISNHDKLSWQKDWAGNTLVNKGILVRSRSLDKPQPQLRTLIIPPDPRPIFNARVEPYSIEEQGPITTQIAQNAAAGATTIFVASVTGFSNGQKIYVYLDNGGYCLVTIGTVNSGNNSFTGLSVPLPSSASINRIVSATGASDVT